MFSVGHLAAAEDLEDQTTEGEYTTRHDQAPVVTGASLRELAVVSGLVLRGG